MGTRNFTKVVRVGHFQVELPRLGTGLAVLGPTVPILCAETLIYLGYFQVALWIHLITFVGCSLTPLIIHSERDLFRAFLLLPLFRLLNFGMPVFVETTLAWLPVVYGGLLAATYMSAVSLPAVRLPDRQNVWQTVVFAPLAIALAAILGSIEYVILYPEPLIETWGGPEMFTFVLVVGVFIGFGEEFLFRGVLQSTISDRAGAVTGVVLTGVLFGMMHSTSGLNGAMLFATAFGLLLGWIYHRTSNLLLVALIHGVLNVLLYGLFPLSGPVIGF